MNRTSFINNLSLAFMCACSIGFITCKQNPTDVTEKSHPTEISVRWDEPIFDEATQTFSLTTYADSTEDATVTYELLDGDQTIMQNQTGQFTGIAPLDDGYFISVRAEWSDTVITAPVMHVNGFVYKERVEQMPKSELESLINAKDREIQNNENPHLIQGLKVKVTNATLEASTLHEVIQYINNGFWPSIKVLDVSYNEENRITSVTLQPTSEDLPEEADEEGYGL